MLRRLMLLLACVLAVAAYSWPLPARLDTVLRDRYDAQTQAWVVAWGQHALSHNPGQLFEANAFAPAHDVLAFSEPLLGYAVLGLPLAWAGLTPAGVLNGLCLLVLALSIWSIACLAVELSAPPGAAFVGAVAAGLGALTTVQLGFVSFTAFGGVAWMVLFCRRLLGGGGLKDALGLALSTAVVGTFSLHFLAFGLGTLFVLGLVRLAAAPRATLVQAAPRLVGALALAGLLLVPLAGPLLRVRKNEGFKRSKGEMSEFSATPGLFLATTPWNPGQAFLPFRSGSERPLYPGTAALVLALAGVVLRRRAPYLPALAGTGATVAVAGALGALGQNGPLWPLLTLLAPPLFGGIRVTVRFGFVLQIGLGLLAAWGAAKLLALVRSGRARLGAAGAVLVLVALDVRQTYPFTFRPDRDAWPSSVFLSRTHTGGPIVHLPLTFEPDEARVVYESTRGFPRVVNGTLSYVPVRHRALATRFDRGPLDGELMGQLEAWPVGMIVLHDHWVPLEKRAALIRFLDESRRSGRLVGPLRFEHRSGSDWVFGLVKAGVVARPSELARHDGGAELRAWEELVGGVKELGWVDVPSLGAAIDQPEEQTVVDELVVRGWGLCPEGPLEIAEVLVNGDRRTPTSIRRTPRADVVEAFPGLGDPARAGFSLRLPRLPEDAGEALLTVRVLAPGGRVRTLHRVFSWR